MTREIDRLTAEIAEDERALNALWDRRPYSEWKKLDLALNAKMDRLDRLTLKIMEETA